MTNQKGGIQDGHPAARPAADEKTASLRFTGNESPPYGHGFPAPLYRMRQRIHGAPSQDRKAYPAGDACG